MRDIITTVYKFEELTPAAQEKAVDSLYDINVDYNWWENIYEDAAAVGIKITSFDTERNRHCCADIPNAIETAELIIKNHGPDCETFKTANSFYREVKPLDDKLEKAERIENNYSYSKSPTAQKIYNLRDELKDKIEDLTEDFKKSICEDYAIMLEKEGEYLTSKEVIIETILANDYEFTAEGRIA